MARALGISLVLGALAFAPSCSPSSVRPQGDDRSDASARVKPTPLPPLEAVRTTLEATIEPVVERKNASEGANPSFPAALVEYEKMGYGQTREAAGWERIVRTLPGDSPPPSGPNRRRLLRFVHMPDLQIADDESPSRLANLDMPTQIDAAMRPQDPDLCRMTHAAVRTIRALHERDPFSFLLLGGDNADNAQTNEVTWALDILEGKDDIECDSGDDDDPIPGPDNDGKDPFASRGLGFPFYWVTGNHDVEVQGNLPVDDNLAAVTLGVSATNGTRDYTQKGGPPRTGSFVVADPRRALLPRSELMQLIANHGDGHGIGATQIESGEATYAFDPPGDSPFRFVVIDTAHAPGGADGVIRRAHIDRIITPLLEQAKADGKWVFLSSHHSTQSLTSNGGAFGREEPDAVLAPAWLAYLGGYPNVIGSFVGHTHRHRINALDAGGRPMWEMMTSAIADFPNQFRVYEIYDEDNGWLSIEATAVDFSTEGDKPAQAGREKAVVDYVSGWITGGVGEPNDHNVQLWVKKP